MAVTNVGFLLCSGWGRLLENRGVVRFSRTADILNSQNTSARGEYLIDCSYRMEFIDGGEPEKIGACRSAYPYIEQAERAFKQAGVRYMQDCSVFFPNDERNFKFIDFAVQEYAPPDYNPSWL